MTTKALAFCFAAVLVGSLGCHSDGDPCSLEEVLDDGGFCVPRTRSDASAVTAEDGGPPRDASLDARSSSWVPVGSDDAGELGLDASDTSAVDAASDGGLDAEVDAASACVLNAEVCNGKDDDCDTRIDEEVSEAPIGTSCDNGGSGVCSQPGKQICSGGAIKCNAPPPTPQPEICDDIDNDCNGQKDDGVAFANKGMTCTAGQGDCQGTGVWECDPMDRTKLRCNAVEKPKTCAATGSCSPLPAEVCDSVDNNCNGAIDEGVGSAWYADCDADGYAAAGAAATTACSAPALTAGCAAWTQRAPAAGTTDCKDANATYHPGAGFDVADETGNGDLNCDGTTERKWPFSGAQLRLDSYLGANGEWNLCDLRVNGTVSYPNSLADFAARGQCPCYVQWEGDVNTGHLKWTTADIACSASTATDVIPTYLRQLAAGTCQPTGALRPGVQRCR